MARIHMESEDELPELNELIRPRLKAVRGSRSPQKKVEAAQPKQQYATAKEASSGKSSKQRSLKRLDPSQSLFGPFDEANAQPKLLSTRREIRTSPRKGKPVKKIEIFEDDKKGTSCCGGDDQASESEEDSYHFSDEAGSDGESWLAPKKHIESPFKKLLKTRAQTPPRLNEDSALRSPTKVTERENPFLGPRMAPPVPFPAHKITSRPTSSSSAIDSAAILHYTPPKRLSPSKKTEASRSSTPPLELPRSPSKKLNSPTKSQSAAIPRGSIRESLDAFWSQDVVNDFNEQYSPRKMVASPRKNRFATPTSDDENGPPSPSTSPRKSQSPRKIVSPSKSKEAREMKKTWDSRKKQLAEDFLNELDQTICNGQLAELSACTGGVQIVWSKKLNTTAGRANWRREKIREVLSDGSTKTWYKHTANIELAEKVIDEEVRLINVVAHEFCHLCNFMINGIRDNPHGKEFKEWAKKVSRNFGERGIEVTTKHSYDIDYKYVWECVDCSLEFKRHSKSIDPAKQACGACKGRLAQTKPAVRANANGPSEYQLFVKAHCQRLKQENPGKPHGAVMEMLGKMYREQKKKASSTNLSQVEDVLQKDAKVDVDLLVKEIEIITLDD